MSLTYPPGPRPVFPILNLRRLQNERLNFLVRNREQYGDVVYYRLGPSRVYQLNHPDYIQTVLVKQAEKFHKSPMLKRTTRQSIGTGLLTSDGDLHKRQRRLVQPAFHANRITAYADVMVDYTLRTLAKWHSGAPVDMSHAMMELTMQIVAKTLFDADVTDSTNQLGAAITVGIETTGRRITQIIQIPDWIPTPGSRERREAAALLENTIMGMINQRRSSGKDTGDLLSMLLMAVDEDDGSGMSNKQVRDEAMTLFIAGHETTANALTWTFYLLAQYPEVEARLVDELKHVLNGRPPRVTDLPQLPYTEMVIKEAMRLYPPAWVVTRQAMEPVEIGGYTIPKGSIILMSQYVMHHHPAYWDEPDVFRPERFSAGYEQRIPRYAYFPFGGGPRICIGNQFAQMEASLVLAAVMQQYHLTLVPGQHIIPEPLITLRPLHGIQMKPEKRENRSESLSLAPETANVTEN